VSAGFSGDEDVRAQQSRLKPAPTSGIAAATVSASFRRIGRPSRASEPVTTAHPLCHPDPDRFLLRPTHPLRMDIRKEDRSRTVPAAAWRILAAAGFWWVLTEGEGGWLFGAVAVLAAVLASLAFAPPGPGLRIAPLGFVQFCGSFVLRSLVAGLQVARFAFAPRPALRPAQHTLVTRLPPGLPRVLLANTLTLQPGTLSVALEEDRLRVHVLDDRQPLEADVRALEARIGAMLRLPA
jgi:multicomponent Na+:H+ antiporter subunit E